MTSSTPLGPEDHTPDEVSWQELDPDLSSPTREVFLGYGSLARAQALIRQTMRPASRPPRRSRRERT